MKRYIRTAGRCRKHTMTTKKGPRPCQFHEKMDSHARRHAERVHFTPPGIGVKMLRRPDRSKTYQTPKSLLCHDVRTRSAPSARSTHPLRSTWFRSQDVKKASSRLLDRSKVTNLPKSRSCATMCEPAPLPQRAFNTSPPVLVQFSSVVPNGDTSAGESNLRPVGTYGKVDEQWRRCALDRADRLIVVVRLDRVTVATSSHCERPTTPLSVPLARLTAVLRNATVRNLLIGR